MSVFKMDANWEVVINPQAVKLVPELAGLDKKQLRYVILVTDYIDSPLRKKPIDERRAMATKMVYLDSKKQVETDTVKLAIKVYKSLVFDIRRETIDIYNQKIRMLQKESLGTEVTFSRMKEIDGTITFMQDRVENMQHQLDIEESEEISVKGGKVLSYLEKWQRKQKAYKEFQEST